MSIRGKKSYLNLNRLERSFALQTDASGKDRRSGRDRRKSSNIRYFLKGGIERRSWVERRYLWYLTM